MIYITDNMLKKILFPTDFSKMASKALPFALDFAKTNKAELILLYIYDVPLMPRANIFTSREQTMKQVAEDLKVAAEKRMADFKVKQGLSNGQCASLVLEGDPVTSIINYANNQDIDLIVMGTHGETADNKMFMGSVSRNVAQKTFCPVFVVPPDAEFGPINSYLYATDLRSDEQFILKYVVGLAKQNEAHVMALHIDDNQENVKWSLDELKELVSKLNYKHLSYHDQVSDDIVAGIQDFMKTYDIDCLALTTHTTSLFDKLFHSSVTKTLMLKSSRPMLIFNQGKSDIIIL